MLRAENTLSTPNTAVTAARNLVMMSPLSRLGKRRDKNANSKADTCASLYFGNKSMSSRCEQDGDDLSIISFSASTVLCDDASSLGESSERTQQGQKKVRFKVDRKDRIKAKVHKVASISVDDRPNVFPTIEELQEIKLEAHLLAEAFGHENCELVARLGLILDSPFQRGGTAMRSKPKVSEHEAIQKICSSGGDDSDLDESIRGLEHRMSPLMRRHQKLATNSIVSRYRSLKEEEQAFAGIGASNPNGSDGGAEEVLKSRCQIVSRSTRELALKFAQGDAAEARKIYKEAGLVSTESERLTL